MLDNALTYNFRLTSHSLLSTQFSALSTHMNTFQTPPPQAHV